MRTAQCEAIQTTLSKITRPEPAVTSRLGRRAKECFVDNNRFIFRRKKLRSIHFTSLGITLTAIAFGIFVSDGLDQALANMHNSVEESSPTTREVGTMSCSEQKQHRLASTSINIH